MFSLVYDELSETENVGPAVRLLLNAMSFLSPDEISEDLLQEILRKKDKAFAGLKDGDDLWDDVREKLTRYDLLKYNKDKCIFTTHRSIQRVIQTKLSTGETRNVCTELLGILSNLFPRYDYLNRLTCEKYSQHVQILLENSDKLCVENETTISLYNKLARYHELLGNLNNSERYYLRSTKNSGEVFGKESADHAALLNNLANIYQVQGRYNEAIGKFEEVLRIGEKILGKEHPNYATSLNNLANVYQLQGRYDEAIEKYEESLRIGEKTIGKEDPHYAIRLNNLAGVYVAQGKLELAEDLHQQAKAIREKALGSLHPDTAQSYWWIAVLRFKQENYAEALPMFEEAYKQFVHFLGEDHPRTKNLEQYLISCREKLK